MKVCAACHSIGAGDLVGPDLKGLTAWRERGWLSRFLIDPQLMLLQKDPIALALDAKYPKATMPYLGLSETDVTDLLAYIDAQSERVDAAQTAKGPADICPLSAEKKRK